VRPQPFQVLQILVQRAGNVVTREDLRAALWPAETFVDFQQGLNTAIKELWGASGRDVHDPSQPDLTRTDWWALFLHRPVRGHPVQRFTAGDED
jgi:hypothetical protein